MNTLERAEALNLKLADATAPSADEVQKRADAKIEELEAKRSEIDDAIESLSGMDPFELMIHDVVTRTEYKAMLRPFKAWEATAKRHKLTAKQTTLLLKMGRLLGDRGYGTRRGELPGVKSLEAKGLVSVTGGSVGDRDRKVSLTPLGQEVLTAAKAAMNSPWTHYQSKQRFGLTY